MSSLGGSGDDDGVIIEDEDPVSQHPSSLKPDNVHVFSFLYHNFWQFMEAYGYLAVVILIILYFVYNKLVEFLENKVSQNRSNNASNLSVEEQMSRMDAMRRAREKLQAEVDKAAVVEAEKQREREEKKRLEKIDDWERHKAGKGYRSKTKADPDASCSRPTYDFLGGGDSSGRYRPSRSNFRRGGGG